MDCLILAEDCRVLVVDGIVAAVDYSSCFTPAKVSLFIVVDYVGSKLHTMGRPSF